MSALHWDDIPAPFPAGLALALGLPNATMLARALVYDGAVWLAAAQDQYGVVATVTHTPGTQVSPLQAGRYPLIEELAEARAYFPSFPSAHDLALLLEPYPQELLERWLAPADNEYPVRPGLASTVILIEVYVQGDTGDLVTTPPEPPA